MCPVCGAIKDLIAPLTKEEIQKYYTSPMTPDEEVKEKDVKEDVKGDVKEEEVNGGEEEKGINRFGEPLNADDAIQQPV